MPPATVLAMPLAVLRKPPPTVANCRSVANPAASPAWLPAPPPIVPNASVTLLAQLAPQTDPFTDAPGAPPPPIAAPEAPVVTVFALLPAMRMGDVTSG